MQLPVDSEKAEWNLNGQTLTVEVTLSLTVSEFKELLSSRLGTRRHRRPLRDCRGTNDLTPRGYCVCPCGRQHARLEDEASDRRTGRVFEGPAHAGVLQRLARGTHSAAAQGTRWSQEINIRAALAVAVTTMSSWGVRLTKRDRECSPENTTHTRTTHPYTCRHPMIQHEQHRGPLLRSRRQPTRSHTRQQSGGWGIACQGKRPDRPAPVHL